MQSQALPERSSLQDRIEAFEAQFEGQETFPKPDYWGGFLIRPVAMEFWRAGDYRLHERVRLTRAQISDPWQQSPLYP